jgi:hypothetical protein
MKRALTLAATAVVLAGCVSPKLTRHYDSADETSVSSNTLTLSVFLANPKVDEAPPLITTLAERGQAELIRSVAARMPDKSDAAALLNVLGKAAPETPEDCAWADKTSLKKRVTMTVLGNLGRPADRIDRLEFRFTLPRDGRYEFASWDKFDSVYGSYDLGSAKYTQSRKLTLGDTNTGTKNLADGAGSVVKALSAGYEASDGLEEDMKYAIRRLSVGGALQAHQATLVQEGGPYINLLGSSSAVFTLKLKSTGDPLPVYVLDFKKDGKAAPEEVGVTLCQVKYPASRAPLELGIDGTALIRLVVNHHDTISEGDDTVRFESRKLVSDPVRIADEADLKAEFFGLASCQAGQSADQCLRLAIENPDSGKVENTLMLRTPGEAASVRDWLVANIRSNKVPGTMGTHRIGLAHAPTEGGGESGTALTPAIVRSLRIMRVADNMAPPAAVKR